MIPDEDRFVNLFAASSLGHGRAVEAMLAGITGLYGCLILFASYFAPDSLYANKAVGDITYELAGYSWLLALPFLAKAALTGYGARASMKNWPGARATRFCGAMLGSFIWFCYVGKYIVVGEVVTLGFSFVLFSALFSIRIMGMALADLPHPGAPGG